MHPTTPNVAPLAPIAAAHTHPADGWFPLVSLLAQHVGSKSLECVEKKSLVTDDRPQQQQQHHHQQQQQKRQGVYLMLC